MPGWSVDVSAVNAALASLKMRMPGSVSVEFEDVAAKIQNTARTVHRYTKRTGKLEQATVAESTRLEIVGYLDESKAHYGKYVHDGQRSWAPDPFLTDAASNLSLDARLAAEKAIDAEIMRAGLQ